MKGYGTVISVDDSGHQHSYGTFNSITQAGIERIITADTAMKATSYPFHFILLSNNLPRDKTVFTKTELLSYGGRLLPIDKTPTMLLAQNLKKISLGFSTVDFVPPEEEDVVIDTLSLVYTDDRDNYHVCSYAEYMSIVTRDPETFTLKAGERISAEYSIDLSILSNEDKTPLTFMNNRPMYLGTEFSGEYTSTRNDTMLARSTRLPYVLGSNKLTWHVDKNTGAGWDCYLVCGLFTLSYRGNGSVTSADGKSGIRHLVEVEFIVPEEAEDKLGLVIEPPVGILQTLGVRDFSNGAANIVEFITSPLANVEFFIGTKFVSSCITDAAGKGVAVFAASYYDEVAKETRQLMDGLLLKTKITNTLGTFEQDYIPIDNVANQIKHWYWIDGTHLRVVGRLNDVVKLYINYGWTKTGTELTDVEVGTITLTELDSRYGFDAAAGTFNVDILTQFNIFLPSTIKVSVTDAAGNHENRYDTIISPNDMGFPNKFELARPNSILYAKGNDVRIDSLVRIPVLTKGTKT